ncbi:MAG TPA: hypothetical protein PKW95_11335 [bacterium]|nr:hypothetical protein [bacterium]
MNRFVLLFVLLSLLTISLAMFACGDDDDDDDGKVYRPGDGSDDDDGDDDDDDGDGSEDCLAFADNFYGENGCVPDEDAYQAMVDLCDELSDVDSDAVADYFACLAAIDCADYDEAIDLYEATATCAQEIID